jgi:hypothetical protein
MPHAIAPKAYDSQFFCLKSRDSPYMHAVVQWWVVGCVATHNLTSISWSVCGYRMFHPDARVSLQSALQTHLPVHKMSAKGQHSLRINQMQRKLSSNFTLVSEKEFLPRCVYTLPVLWQPEQDGSQIITWKLLRINGHLMAFLELS